MRYVVGWRQQGSNSHFFHVIRISSRAFLLVKIKYKYVTSLFFAVKRNEKWAFLR